MINYYWNCKTVDCYIEEAGDADVVYNVHWIVTGTSSEVDPEGNPYSARVIGMQPLNIDDITDFIPFVDLTNEQIVIWTQTAMGVEQVTSIEANITSQINLLINPVLVTLTVES